MNLPLFTKNIMRTNSLYLFLACGLLFIQCNSGTQKKSQGIPASADTSGKQVSSEPKQVIDSIPTISAEKKEAISKINFLLPSPDEILGEIIPNKVDYNPQLVNPKVNVSNYISTKYQALNLGVYLTDFAYLNLNDKKNDALAYFKTVRELAQKVNIYGLFNEAVYNRIQNNLTNKDSLSEISKEIYYKMLDILESSKRNNIYALTASGALIEALYLSTMVVKNYTDYQIVAQKIFEQKYVLSNFYEFASQFNEDKDVKSVLIQINDLKRILENTALKMIDKKVKVDKNDHITIGGGEDIIIDEATFKRFKDSVIKTRMSLINVSNK